MFRSCLSVAAVLLFGPLAGTAAEGDEPKPAAKPEGNHVSLQVDGCGDKCAEFEISIFENGRLLFQPNNSKNSTAAPFSKNGISSIYTRVSKYLQDTAAFSEPGECTDRKADAPFAVVESVHDGQVQKATWSAGCANQVEKARSLVKVFVNQSGMWRNINHDSRYWEKYWETWEDKKSNGPPSFVGAPACTDLRTTSTSSS
jgi:hypothetical protein